MVDSGSTGTFVYDPFGRRVSKTILGSTINFFYDGENPVQELSGATPTANLLSGTIDEYFTRTDSAGIRSFLRDAVGSALALTDSTGSVQTQYAYDAFGGTTSSGQASTNTFQYTDRENDNIGIYYYRARYYSPGFGRFISEDPVGFFGGLDFYAYVGDNPSNAADPLGLCKEKCLQEANRRFIKNTEGEGPWRTFAAAQPNIPSTIGGWGFNGLRKVPSNGWSWNNWSPNNLAWSYWWNLMWNGTSEGISYWKNWYSANKQYERDVEACEAQ
jgi:RHS repeat-associated protein